MNRRSFLKSAALAAVAVPVVGLPDVPVAVTTTKPPMLWVIQYRKWDGFRDTGDCGTAWLTTQEQMLNWYEKVLKWGYNEIRVHTLQPRHRRLA